MYRNVFAPFFVLVILFSILFGNQPINQVKAQDVSALPMTFSSTTNSSVTEDRFGDTTTALALTYPSQRKTFYANERHWIFYSNGTHIVYKTSVDGITWILGENNPIREGAGRDSFSIWFDETYLHYAFTISTYGIGLSYKRGVPNANGTITWTTAEQTAVSGISSIILSLPFVAVDTENHPWIVYKCQNGNDCYPYVTKSSSTNGTWSTDINFPFKLSNYRSISWVSTITPLTNSKMYVISLTAAHNYRIGRLWNGTAWESEESPITVSSINCGTHSVVAQGDDVHLAFLDTPNLNIKYRKRFYSNSSWGREVMIKANTTYTSDPVLSIDTLTNNLYIFWMGSPSPNSIYYKKGINGTWDANPTTLKDATSNDGLTSNDALSGYYKQGLGQNGNYIGLVYLVRKASPYDVAFAYLSLNHTRTHVYDSQDVIFFIQCYKGLAPPELMYLADLGGGLPPQFFEYDGLVDAIDLALFVRSYHGEGPQT